VLVVGSGRGRVPASAISSARTATALERDVVGVTTAGSAGVPTDTAGRGAADRQGPPDRGAPAAADDGGVGREPLPYTRTEVLRAYAPYVIIIAMFVLANLSPVKKALGRQPWTTSFAWPGLHVLSAAGKPVSTTTFAFNWLPAAGTLLVVAGILSAVVLRVPPRRALAAYGRTYAGLRWAIVCVMAVLALAYVMNLSGQTASLGAFLARAGGFFPVLAPILGWLGVAVTGSDTSSNALFGALQVQTAARAGLDPVLLAAANSSGGVLGKMISPQNLAIAAAAVGRAGHEGELFRKVLGWSLALLALMVVLVVLQSTSVLSWMVP
jgi:lactate permease